MEKVLSDYFEQYLLDLIKIGLPLDLDCFKDLQTTLVNYASAQLYSDNINKYIQAMLDPLDTKPFVQISPFMTREKLDLNSRRTIMYLSILKALPDNNGALKDTYLGTDF